MYVDGEVQLDSDPGRVAHEQLHLIERIDSIEPIRDTCVIETLGEAMALTAKEMNSKYKETSEGGLAVSVVLC